MTVFFLVLKSFFCISIEKEEKLKSLVVAHKSIQEDEQKK